MENIWAFLLQALTVSFVAALILFLKWLFRDKLSPRWVVIGEWRLSCYGDSGNRTRKSLCKDEKSESGRWLGSISFGFW